MNEVAAFQEAIQFMPGKTQFACGYFAVMMALSMAPAGHSPILSMQEVIGRAEDAYSQYDGQNDGSNTYGMTLQQEYDLLHQVGLHYQSIALEDAVCMGWLACGYPICAAVAESSVFDQDLSGNPYPWQASGNHVILLTGVAGDAYLTRDSANCTDLYDPASLRAGPRRYTMQPLQLVSATVVVPPWMPQPTSAVPPSEGGPAMPDTHNQSNIDMWKSMDHFFTVVYGAPLARDTGIFKSAFNVEKAAGRFRGVPIGPEYNTVDDRGVAIVAQNWTGGICHWYPKTNMAIWV